METEIYIEDLPPINLEDEQFIVCGSGKETKRAGVKETIDKVKMDILEEVGRKHDHSLGGLYEETPADFTLPVDSPIRIFKSPTPYIWMHGFEIQAEGTRYTGAKPKVFNCVVQMGLQGHTENEDFDIILYLNGRPTRLKRHIYGRDWNIDRKTEIAASMPIVLSPNDLLSLVAVATKTEVKMKVIWAEARFSEL